MNKLQNTLEEDLLNSESSNNFFDRKKSISHIVTILAISGLGIFLAPPVYAGSICQDDPLCYIWLFSLAYVPYFFIITLLTFIIIKFFRPSVSLGNKILLSLSISLASIIFYDNFMSIWIEKNQISNSNKNILRQVSYKLYEPSYLPSGYRLSETIVYDQLKDNAYLSFIYNKDNVNFILSEYIKPSSLSLNPPMCKVYGSGFEIRDGASFTQGTSGNCQEIKTPKGTSIYLMKYKITEPQNYALTVFDNTLITIARYNFSDQELINLIDNLQEKKAAEIDMKIDNRTIGR